MRANERFPECSYLEIGIEKYVTENALCIKGNFILVSVGLSDFEQA